MDCVPCKIVSGQTYIHVCALPKLPSDKKLLLRQAEKIAGVSHEEHFNLVRYDNVGQGIALLNYPGFFEEPFPALHESWKIDIAGHRVGYRSFVESRNPPILHRKELFLPADDPRREVFENLTKAAEKLGLFENPRKIGYQRQWLELIRSKDVRIEGHSLVPQDEKDLQIDADESLQGDDQKISRHLTALTRYGFSAPVSSLARHGFLDGTYSIFDYGCGRGDDVRGLLENGLSASGWDPYFASSNSKIEADIVNLGFVVNVIEDPHERQEAVKQAWSLTQKLMVVSVMLSSQNQASGQKFQDGVMTSRGTFQKYFTQSEFKHYLQQVLDQQPIPVAPGIFYIFRDEGIEQRFLIERYSKRRNRLQAPSPQRIEALKKRQQERDIDQYEKFKEQLERLWDKWLRLGRRPDKSEIDDLLTLTQAFGSAPRALRFIEQQKDPAQLEQAAISRIEDLEVYFALNQFERRQPYKHMDKGLQRDIKAFFGNYRSAQSQSRELLFRIADVEAIEEACQHAAEHGLGWLQEGEYLQLHVSLVEQLPPLLRVYLGCAFVLYGDYQSSDLVKIHIQSGKVSLMRFDDFEGRALPRMVERVKIKLRQQDIDFFSYGEGGYEAPYLYRKSRYINEEFSFYPEQCLFDEELESTALFDLSDYGPEPDHFQKILEINWLSIEGFRLVKRMRIPALDEMCGEHLTYRQLIECGETQARTNLSNSPKKAETYGALLGLTVNILDPVIDYYGMIKLTYGFCSAELAKKILSRISPKLDQHASHELNQRGSLICERLGAAVDFKVEDECMLEVAQWIVQNTPFDRLYFYGKDKPIHVSYGPDNVRQVVHMKASKTGRLMPGVVSEEKFCVLD